MKLLPVVKALRFNNQVTSELTAISRSGWPSLLRETDREGLTLPLGVRCKALLPPMIQARVEHNLACNAQRHTRLLAAYAEIDGALSAKNLEFAMLKGLSKSRYYAADLRYRPQYDIDIYLPEASLLPARDAMQMLGYEALPEAFSSDADHLPRMIRKTGWRWREDYYDPEMPTAVELHFQFWNAQEERFGPGDLTREVAGLQLPALSEVDALSYSTLHLLRHLLRGALQLHHVYEMAHFLHTSAGDDAFWNEWRASGLASCRIAEAIAFRLAAEWFDCSLHPAARHAVERLPNPIQRWFDLFAAGGNAGKNELLLHLCLVANSRDRREIVLRRLFPVHRGRVSLEAHVPAAKSSALNRLRSSAYEAAFILKRVAHHALTLGSTLWSGLRWLALEKRLAHPRHS
jgi:hypothetical protein